MSQSANQRNYQQELLNAISSEESFFKILQELYQDIGCGVDLSFEDIPVFWRGESNLPPSWRIALGQQLSKHASGRYLWHMEDEVKAAHRWIFTSADPVDWIAVSERLVTLLCPFFSAYDLASRLVAKPDYTPKTMPKSTYIDKMLKGMATWSQSLNEGRDDWAEFHGQLLAVGSDPALLHSLLANANPHRSNVDLNGEATQELSSWITYFAIMRLISADSTNAERVMAQRYEDLPKGGGSSSRGALWSREEWYALYENYYRPANRAFAQYRDLQTLPENARHHVFNDWCNGQGLIEAWIDSPDKFRQWLKSLPENVRMSWLSEHIQRRYPDSALVFEQERFAKFQTCSFQLETTKARDWYRSILHQLTPSDFGKAFQQLSKFTDDTQRLDLVWQYVHNGEQTTYSMLRGISDASELLRLINSHSVNEVRSYAANELNCLAWDIKDDEGALCDRNRRHPQNWPVLREACETHPNLLAESLHNSDAELWQIAWDKASPTAPEGEDQSRRRRSTESGETRDVLVAQFMDQLRYGGRPYDDEMFAMVGSWYLSDASRFYRALDNCYSDSFENMIQAIGSHPDSPLMGLVPDLAARTLSQGSGWFSREQHSVDGGIVDLALSLFPEKFGEMDVKKSSKLLQAMGPKGFLACRESLAKLFATKQKTVRTPALELVSRTSPTIILQSELLNSRTAKTRQLVLIGLALNPDPDALPLVREYINDSAHDQPSRDLSLDALRAP